jgi:chromosome segregation ATPase
MQSELSAAREEVARLRHLLNRAEARFVQLADAEVRKREREERHGVDMVEPDLNTPDFAAYQLESLEKRKAELETTIQNMVKQYKILQRQRDGSVTREEEVALNERLQKGRGALADVQVELETVQREIAMQKRRLGRVNACLACEAPVERSGRSFCGKSCERIFLQQKMNGFYA